MNRKLSQFIGIFLTLSLIFSLAGFHFSQADTVEQLNNQRDKLQLRLAELNKQIKGLQSQIGDTQKQQASLKNELRIFDAQILSLELAIEARVTQIEDADLQIRELEYQIQRREAELATEREDLGHLITLLARLDDSYGLQLLFGSDSFSVFLDQVEYTTQLNHSVHRTIENIKAVKVALESQQKEREGQREEMENLKAGLEDQQGLLAMERGNRQKLLDKTRGLEKGYQQLLSASSTEKESIDDEIQDLDAKVRAALGQRSISPGKGVLARPMSGVLTQGYGNTGFRALGYTFHNGLDIAAPAGTPIYAAADGTVTACDSSNAGYGNWCTVKHNIETSSGSRCIVTLYAHMRSISVTVGQSLKQGDSIGTEGNTGNTTRLLYGSGRGYHLHFTVFDCEGFGINSGKFSKSYGSYKVPYGYTYNPADFLK